MILGIILGKYTVFRPVNKSLKVLLNWLNISLFIWKWSCTIVQFIRTFQSKFLFKASCHCTFIEITFWVSFLFNTFKSSFHLRSSLRNVSRLIINLCFEHLFSFLLIVCWSYVMYCPSWTTWVFECCGSINGTVTACFSVWPFSIHWFIHASLS